MPAFCFLGPSYMPDYDGPKKRLMSYSRGPEARFALSGRARFYPANG